VQGKQLGLLNDGQLGGENHLAEQPVIARLRERQVGQSARTAHFEVIEVQAVPANRT
jgi:hypothetical protein